jgi:hypothetical protein
VELTDDPEELPIKVTYVLIFFFTFLAAFFSVVNSSSVSLLPSVASWSPQYQLQQSSQMPSGQVV